MKTVRGSQARGVDAGGVAGDDALGLQPLHAARAGRGGEAHALGKLGDGQTAIGLQLGDDLGVDAIHWGKSPRFEVTT
jgi:hypothetical protein